MEDQTPKASSLRWKILRNSLLRHHPPNQPGVDEQSQVGIDHVSRKTNRGFRLIPFEFASKDQYSDGSDCSKDRVLCYTLPIHGAPKLFITQRQESQADLLDFAICNAHNIDNTGIVCHWPSEEVLAYYCLMHTGMFRSKKVIELGSGYGLAGLVIAAATEASEVVISDGNPQVVNYIQRNIEVNSGKFGKTEVRHMMLHWNQSNISSISNSYDIIVASDCTFFKEFHTDLTRIVKYLLKREGPAEAIFFSPRRGDSLDKFLKVINDNGLSYSISENYDTEIWKQHEHFINGDDSWPGYLKDHCYPLLVKVRH